MESLKIVLLCACAAIFYGVVHDQFTVRVCLEYFTVFHPPVFSTRSPTLLALGWGVIATWCVGAILGALLAISSRAGSAPKLQSGLVLRPILKLLAIMAVSAFAFGLAGYLLGKSGKIAPPMWVVAKLDSSARARFMADWWAHSASYAAAFFGGMVLCVAMYRKRKQVKQESSGGQGQIH